MVPIKNNNDDKLQVINIILELYPTLKKDRQNIINVVFGKLNKPIKYILTKIMINNYVYYIDTYGLLFDNTITFKGIMKNNELFLLNDNYDIELEEYNKYLKK